MMKHLKTVRRKPTVWDRILNSLDLSRETAPVLVILMAGFLMVIFLLVLTNGNALVSVAALIAVGIILFTFYRIDFIFYLFIFAVLLFDQFEILNFYPLTFRVQFFQNINSISAVSSDNAGIINPLEIQIGLLILAWLMNIAVNKKMKIRPIPVWFAFIVLFGLITASVVYGVMQGGEFLASLWEVRALFYLGLMYLIVPQIIQTRKQLHILIWVILIAMTIKVLPGLVRFVIHAFSTESIAALTYQPDPVFMVTIFYMLAALLIFNVKSGNRIYIIAVLLILLLNFYVGYRRATIVSLGTAGFVFFILVENKYRWRMIKIMGPILILGAIYMGFFWNSNSKFARPVQLVKSGITAVAINQNKADYNSDINQDDEDYNPAVIARKNMYTGIGFGRQNYQSSTLDKISIPLDESMIHNDFLWIFLKTGIFGFFAFLFFLNTFVFKGAFVYKNLRDPFFKAVLEVVIIAVINQMVVSYFDLQFSYYRNMVYLGTLMGLLSAIEDMDKEYESPEAEDEFGDGLSVIEY